MKVLKLQAVLFFSTLETRIDETIFTLLPMTESFKEKFLSLTFQEKL
jgi:hypothetical protein